MTLISYILFFIAGMCNGCMDLVGDDVAYSKSIFPKSKNKRFWLSRDYYCKNESWIRKYKNGNFYEGPRFPFSTNIFVFTTDFWHLVKFFMISLLALGAVFMQFPTALNINGAVLIIINFIFLKTAFSLGFTFIYHKIGLKKR